MMMMTGDIIIKSEGRLKTGRGVKFFFSLFFFSHFFLRDGAALFYY
jgi:hypothetical protein